MKLPIPPNEVWNKIGHQQDIWNMTGYLFVAYPRIVLSLRINVNT